MTTLRAVLFDFDGTLWDSETAVFGVFRELYREHGKELTLRTWSAAIGTLDGFDPYASLQELVGGRLDVEQVRARTEERIRETVREIPLRPGVEAFLRRLDDAGVPRALVSSDRTEWLVTNLERLGRPDGWAAMVCADGDAARAKPNPHLYEAALELLGVRADGDVRDRGLAERDPRREGRRHPVPLRPERGDRRARPLGGRPRGSDVRGTVHRRRVERAAKEVGMKVLKIGFVGTRTDRPEAMVDFFERTLALRPMHGGDDMWAFRLPDGSIAEVFGPSQNDHATTGPVVEFLVEDVVAATEELRAAGVPIVLGPVRADEVGLAWTHFRAPDGNLYGVIEIDDRRPNAPE